MNDSPTTAASGASPPIDMIRVASRTVPKVHGPSRHSSSGIRSIDRCRTGRASDTRCSTPVSGQVTVNSSTGQAMALGP